MNWLIYIAIATIFLFASALLFGAPFLPTLRIRTAEALDLLNLKKGQTLLELGSGDGRILREAAKRGITAVGYEINPLLVVYSTILNWKYRKLIRVYWRNYWHVPLLPADGIYVFLLNPYMVKMDKKIVQEIHHKIKVVSFAFAFPKRQPTKDNNGLMLYEFLPDPKKQRRN